MKTHQLSFLFPAGYEPVLEWLRSKHYELYMQSLASGLSRSEKMRINAELKLLAAYHAEVFKEYTESKHPITSKESNNV